MTLIYTEPPMRVTFMVGVVTVLNGRLIFILIPTFVDASRKSLPLQVGHLDTLG